jgi:hypothetical protein
MTAPTVPTLKDVLNAAHPSEIADALRKLALGTLLTSEEYDTGTFAISTPPTNATFTAGAGILPAATYYYRVVAKSAVGNTLPSTETSLVLAAVGGVLVKWGALAGATGYDIYGRSTGAELYMASVDANTLQWLDNGSVVPAGALPTALLTTVVLPYEAAYVQSARIVTATTASIVGTYMAADSSATAITAGTSGVVGICKLGVDRKTLTFLTASDATRVIVRYSRISTPLATPFFPNTKA